MSNYFVAEIVSIVGLLIVLLKFSADFGRRITKLETVFDEVKRAEERGNDHSDDIDEIQLALERLKGAEEEKQRRRDLDSSRV